MQFWKSPSRLPWHEHQHGLYRLNENWFLVPYTSPPQSQDEGEKRSLASPVFLGLPLVSRLTCNLGCTQQKQLEKGFGSDDYTDSKDRGKKLVEVRSRQKQKYPIPIYAKTILHKRVAVNFRDSRSRQLLKIHTNINLIDFNM